MLSANHSFFVYLLMIRQVDSNMTLQSPSPPSSTSHPAKASVVPKVLLAMGISWALGLHYVVHSSHQLRATSAVDRTFNNDHQSNPCAEAKAEKALFRNVPEEPHCEKVLPGKNGSIVAKGFWHISLVYPEAFVQQAWNGSEIIKEVDEAFKEAKAFHTDINALPWRRVVEDEYQTIIDSGVLVSGLRWID